MGVFGCKPVNQFEEPYHSVVGCAWNMEDPILNNSVNSLSTREISSVFLLTFY
jgi:hypothetical protein